MDIKKFCPYIYDCKKPNQIDLLRCFGNYEICNEYSERNKNLEEKVIDENIFKNKKTEQ